MLQVIYVSKATRKFSGKELIDLLKVSRENNGPVDVTGILLYHNESFLQVLEGPEENVEAVYEKIQKDPRHTNFLLLLRRTIEKKEFGNWSMGFVDANKTAARVEGFVEYLSCLKNMTLDAGRARILLNRFQEGSYRPAQMMGR